MENIVKSKLSNTSFNELYCDKHKSYESPYYQKMGISSISAFIELTGGQPLDRWKMNLQIPKSERIPFMNLVKLGPREWYVASNTTIIQRCFFYIPTIYLAQDIWKTHFMLTKLHFVMKYSKLKLTIIL